MKSIGSFRSLLVAASFCLLAFYPGSQARAQGTSALGVCNSATPAVLATLCLDSMFPVMVSGIDLGSGLDGIGAPPNAYRAPLCWCGGLRPGIPYGQWVPTQIIEVTRNPGCSPVFGVDIPGPFGASGAPAGGFGTDPSQHGTFRHVNAWPNPLASVLGGLAARCLPNAILETTAWSLMWQPADPVMSNMLYPEWAAIAINPGLVNIFSMSGACAANSFRITDFAYFLADCWGPSLPATGHMQGKTGVEATSLAGVKQLMHSARLAGYGMWQTAGPTAVCGPHPTPFPQKSAFKYSMLFPVTEAIPTFNPLGISGVAAAAQSLGLVSAFDISSLLSVCAHRVGQDVGSWGNARTIPTVGEDHVYMLWRWIDCCKMPSSGFF